jgi:hypothetical protein
MLGYLDRSSKIMTILCFLAVLFLWFFVFWRWRVSEDFAPLHYSVYFGFDRFGPKSDLFLYPFLGTVIFIVNTLIALRIFYANKFGKLLILSFTLFLLLILFSSFILITLKTAY